jgi:hypothetical protein
MAIYRGPGGSGDATDDAANAAELIIQKTDEAAGYAASASTSATNAATSAASAASSASGVSASAAAAAASAAAALSSETNAASSASSASSSASSASSSASTATTKASEASASASSASSSASSASTSASNASTSASNAASSASSASSSASAASTSAGNAAISESNAASSAATAAGYVPSVTGQTGKYLRTNGTSNYWDTVDAFPSQSGNSGKFLTTNGTATSWAAVPNPNEATVTDSGLVYGQTDLLPPSWSGTIINGTSYQYTVIGSNHYLAFGNSIVLYRAQEGYLSVGQQISVNDGTNNINYGVITGLTVTSTECYIYTSLHPYSSTTNLYCATLTLVGATYGGNTALGHAALTNGATSSNNTIIGYAAGAAIVNGDYNIIIGANANAASDVSNEAIIGSSIIQTTRLYGALAVGGTSKGTSGQVLTSNGSSSAPSWTTLTTGTVTSVALSAPTGLTVTGTPITSSGTLALSYTAGYSIPTTASQANWDTAYGWGNHASAGYLTSATAASTYAPLTGTGTSGTWGISITGNAATVTNGLYSTGSYANPSWLTSLDGSKITGTINGGTY